MTNTQNKQTWLSGRALEKMKKNLEAVVPEAIQQAKKSNSSYEQLGAIIESIAEEKNIDVKCHLQKGQWIVKRENGKAIAHLGHEKINSDWSPKKLKQLLGTIQKESNSSTKEKSMPSIIEDSKLKVATKRPKMDIEPETAEMVAEYWKQAIEEIKAEKNPPQDIPKAIVNKFYALTEDTNLANIEVKFDRNKSDFLFINGEEQYFNTWKIQSVLGEDTETLKPDALAKEFSSEKEITVEAEITYKEKQANKELTEEDNLDMDYDDPNLDHIPFAEETNQKPQANKELTEEDNLDMDYGEPNLDHIPFAEEPDKEQQTNKPELEEKSNLKQEAEEIQEEFMEVVQDFQNLSAPQPSKSSESEHYTKFAEETQKRSKNWQDVHKIITDTPETTEITLIKDQLKGISNFLSSLAEAYDDEIINMLGEQGKEAFDKLQNVQERVNGFLKRLNAIEQALETAEGKEIENRKTPKTAIQDIEIEEPETPPQTATPKVEAEEANLIEEELNSPIYQATNEPKSLEQLGEELKEIKNLDKQEKVKVLQKLLPDIINQLNTIEDKIETLEDKVSNLEEKLNLKIDNEKNEKAATENKEIAKIEQELPEKISQNLKPEIPHNLDEYTIYITEDKDQITINVYSNESENESVYTKDLQEKNRPWVQINEEEALEPTELKQLNKTLNSMLKNTNQEQKREKDLQIM